MGSEMHAQPPPIDKTSFSRPRTSFDLHCQDRRAEFFRNQESFERSSKPVQLFSPGRTQRGALKVSKLFVMTSRPLEWSLPKEQKTASVGKEAEALAPLCTMGNRCGKQQRIISKKQTWNERLIQQADLWLRILTHAKLELKEISAFRRIPHSYFLQGEWEDGR